MKLYKTLKDNEACDGGSFDYSEYIKNKSWLPTIDDLKMCERGYHLTDNPFNHLDNALQIFEVIPNDIKGQEGDKILVDSFKFVKELSSKEIRKLSKKLNKVNYDELNNNLGNIPTKKDVIVLMKKIEKVDWFKPQTPIKAKLQIKVDSILKAFKLDVKAEVQINKLDSASAWNSARASACDSAWDSARASACDSARASEFEVVKDLMQKKGYAKNPFKELFSLWEMGLYPVGLLKDGKFHIYYVPKKKVRK